MIVCPACESSELVKPEYICTKCGYHPDVVNGFLAWAPELANNNSGFRPEYFSGLYEAESEHFWFRARNMLILWSLLKYFPNFQSFLEVGCGTAFVLSAIAKENPLKSMAGSEIYPAGLEYASRRVPEADLFQMDARQCPYDEEFDVVGAFDVIEHIQEDELVLQNIYRAVKPGGGCLITVPQHMWLWSSTDEQACHQRRYEKEELLDKIRNAGFEVVRTTSFVSSLLPAMALSRLLQKHASVNEGDPTETLKISAVLNAILYSILRLEFALIKMGINYPVGGSRLVVARKLLVMK